MPRVGVEVELRLCGNSFVTFDSSKHFLSAVGKGRLVDVMGQVEQEKAVSGRH